MISKVERKEVQQGTRKVQRAAINVTFSGQSDIKPEYVDFINVPAKKPDGTFETKARSLTTELVVEVWADKLNPTTGLKEKKRVKQRIRGKYEVPVFVRAKAYENEFGVQENKDVISREVTDEDFKNAEQKTQFFLSLIATSGVTDVSKYGSLMTEYAEKLKAAGNAQVDTEQAGF